MQDLPKDKYCAKCGHTKDSSQFYVSRGVYLSKRCRTCTKARPINREPQVEKYCKKCDSTKKIDQFYETKANYYSSYCKLCVKSYRDEKYGCTDYDLKYYEKNKDKFRVYQHDYYGANTVKVTNRNHKYYLNNKDKFRVYQQNYESEHVPARKAYGEIQKGLEKGLIIKPDKCECCGTKNNFIDAHHMDYTRPLDVIWTCRKMHRRFHSGNNPAIEKLFNKLWKEKFGEDI